MNTLETSCVVPDVIDAFNPTDVELRVQYGKNTVTDGVQFAPTDAVHMPEVIIKGRSDRHYTLLMVDPDAPSPDKPTNRDWVHWIVTDIPGDGDFKNGHQLVEYNGPTPPKGNHRYVFIACEQQSGHAQARVPETRGGFDTKAWIHQHGLQPRQAHFFYCQK